MPKRLKRTILYGGYLLLVTLPLLEIGVRMWGYSERHIYDPIYRVFEPSEDIPYIHKPNLIHAQGRGLAIINTDSLGLRAKTSGMVYGTKQSHEYRIAIVGDSNTFGEGILRTEDTFAQVLEDLLNQKQQTVAAKVFNFGASAYSVKQMSAALQHRMVNIQPDLVVMAIIPEDFNLSRTPNINKAGYLIDHRIPILPDSRVREILQRIHLMYVFRTLALSWFPSPQNGAPLLSHGEIPESYRYIQQFAKTADQQKLPYVIVLLPRMQDNAWGLLPNRLTQDGIHYLDLLSLTTEFTPEEYMASRFDPHGSPAVHRRIGESLAEYVQHQPEFLQ